MSSRHRSRSRSPRRRSKSPRRKRNSLGSPREGDKRRSSPRGRHGSQEESKTLSRAGRDDTAKETGSNVVEESQTEQRTDRFKSERFEGNEQAKDSKSKDWLSSEGERRGDGRAYRGRGRFGPPQQEWRGSNKLEESLSDPTHVPRLGQFFEHDNRDAPPRPRLPPHDAPPPNGDQGSHTADNPPKESPRPNLVGGRGQFDRGRGMPDHGWGRQSRRKSSPEVWKHDLFDVLDQSPSPPADDDEEEVVKCRSVVQKIPPVDDKWLHDKFEVESGNERRRGAGADSRKWAHDKFEADSGNDRRGGGRGPPNRRDRWMHDKFEDSRGDRRERRDQGDRRRRRDERGEGPRGRSPHRYDVEVSDRWGKKGENKAPPRGEEKSVPMDTSALEA